MGQPQDKIKILYIITQGEPGGAQQYVFDLSTNLDRTKYEILVAVGTGSNDLADKLALSGIKTQTFKHLTRQISPLQDFLAIREISRLIQKYEPDIIHLNSSKAGFLGSLARKHGKIQSHILFTAHGFAFLEPQHIFTRQIYYWAERLASGSRDKIIAVSEYDRMQGIKAKIAPTEKFVTIHNGISLDIPAAQKEEESYTGKPKKNIIIGTIANLYNTKGLEYLIQAAIQIIKKYPEVQFQVIGDGKERINLESHIKNHSLGEKFLLLGQIKNAKQYLSKFDIFVLPSLKEGFPYTILEAMSTGLPIVATNVGGIPEAIRDRRDGLLVAPRDSMALAQAIEELIKNPAYAKTLGRSAKEQVKEFSLQKMLLETEQEYQKLLGKLKK